LAIAIAHCCCPSPLPIASAAVSANFWHVKMEACWQDHGNGSMGTWSWSMGTGAWRWDSEAIFFLVVLCTKNIFDGDGAVRQFFLVVFCNFFITWVEFCQFLHVRMEACGHEMWEWEHRDMSMEHGDGNVEAGQWINFFLVVFCKKNYQLI
jgi:hypothetical protein